MGEKVPSPFCADFSRNARWENEANVSERRSAAKDVTDIYYLHHRNTHNGKATRKVLQNLLEIFSLADTAGSDCRNALLSETADFEDAVMIETARRIKADCIVTRNKKDYLKSPVAVMSPEEFLSALEAN